MLILAIILILPYFFTILKIYTDLFKIRQFTPTDHNIVFISVVIAFRNEAANIPGLLTDIAKQLYPTDRYEVIMVDDNSSDGSFEIASGIKHPSNLKVIKNNGKGKKAALRAGIDISAGDLILTTDCDCRMGEKWISTISAFYDAHKPDMIICPVTLGSSPGFFGKFQELEFLSLQGITAGNAVAGIATMCNGANLAFKKEAYLKHFDNIHPEIASGDDIFLLHSLKKEKGVSIMWLESTDSFVTASPSQNIMSFILQRKRWISKGKYYKDRVTIVLAIITFVTNFIQIPVLVAGIFLPEYLKIWLLIFTLKSIPDYLLLNKTAARYGREKLMRWFLPSQIIYPFYILIVALFTLMCRKKGVISYPFQKGT